MKIKGVAELKRWRQFRGENQSLLLSLMVLTIITYSSKLFLYSYSIDTELFIRNGVPFKWWVSLGRYGLAILAWPLTIGLNVNVILTNIVTYGLLFLSIVFLMFIIWRTAFKINKIWLFIAGGLYLTSPIMLEQTNFILQSIPVMVALNLLYGAILCIQYFDESHQWPFFAVAVILAVGAFSVYPSLQVAFVILALISLYLLHAKLPFLEYLIKAIPYVGVLISAGLLNRLFSKIMMMLLATEPTNYLKGMYIIGKVPFKVWLVQVLRTVKHTFFGLTYFNFGLATWLSIFCLIAGLFLLLIKKTQSLSYTVIVMGSVLITDLAIGAPVLLMGRLGPIRSYAPTFSIAVLFLTLLLVTNISSRWIKGILAAGLMIGLAGQVKITNDFGVSEYNQFQAELQFKTQLENQLDNTQIESKNHYKLAIYGTKDFASDQIMRGNVLGKSFFEWDAGTERGVTGRVSSFLFNQGLDIPPVSPTDYQRLSANVAQMAVFPANNSVKVVGKAIIVKLSQ